VWFRRPARDGSLRSANVTAQNCVFLRIIMPKSINNQLTYCPLWFLDAPKIASCTKRDTTLCGKAASGRMRVVVSGSDVRLMDERSAGVRQYHVMNCILTRGGSTLLKLVSPIYMTVGLSMEEAGAVWYSPRLRLIRLEPARAMIVGLPGRVISLGHVSDPVSCSGLTRRPKKGIIGYGSALETSWPKKEVPKRSCP